MLDHDDVAVLGLEVDEQPGLEDRGPSELVWLQVDHAASTDSRGRGLVEVGDLEEHSHVVGHLDDLSVVEAEHLVVVEDGVHVLDPISGHRPVEDNELPVSGGVSSAPTIDIGQHSFSPLPGDQVRVPEELLVGQRFGVDHELVAH